LDLLGVDLVTLRASVEPKASTHPKLSAALREAGAIAVATIAGTGVAVAAETASTTLPLLAKCERSGSIVGPRDPWWQPTSHLDTMITTDGGVASLTALVEP
jgi:hypothetical protein